jgi:two-component system, cell cycle response regulator DivK
MNVYSGQKILVVEDNFMSFKLLEAHCERVNLTMVYAMNGRQAIEKFRADQDIKIILMDIQIPEMNGLEVTREIRKSDPGIPIIATTGNVFDDDRIACMEAGCTHFLRKPINFTELYSIFDKYLKP